MGFFTRNWLFITVVVAILAASTLGFFAGRATAPATETLVEPAPADSSAATPAPDATAPAATTAVVDPVAPAASAAEDDLRGVAYDAEAAAAAADAANDAVTRVAERTAALEQRVGALETKSAATPAPTPAPAVTPATPVAPEERYEEGRIRAKWRGYPRSAGVSYFNLRKEGRTFNVRPDDPENFRAWLAREEAEFQAWLKGTKP